MTELRTLKDLDWDINESYFKANPEVIELREKRIDEMAIGIKELKQEAIKWVKFLDTKIITSGSPMWRSEFMDFFNLTEEDLR